MDKGNLNMSKTAFAMTPEFADLFDNIINLINK